MLNFTSMVDMARTPAEVKGEVAKYYDTPASAADGKRSAPVYPYGLCLAFDDETLKKLGLDDELPEVGQTVQFTAEARVTSASENERETTGGKVEKCRRVELQICRMGVPAASAADLAEEKSEALRGSLYGDAAENDD